jgi:hypothetical protein
MLIGDCINDGLGFDHVRPPVVVKANNDVLRKRKHHALFNAPMNIRSRTDYKIERTLMRTEAGW